MLTSQEREFIANHSADDILRAIQFPNEFGLEDSLGIAAWVFGAIDTVRWEEVKRS